MSWKVPALHLGLFGGAMPASDRMIFYDFAATSKELGKCALSQEVTPYFTLFYGIKKSSFGVGECRETLSSLNV